jgi:hypothetical protein
VIRRVAGAVWNRVNHHSHPDPAPPPATVADNGYPNLKPRLTRLARVTRAAMASELLWSTGLAAKDIEKFDTEFLKHLDTLPRNDRAALYVRAAAQLEVQS